MAQTRRERSRRFGAVVAVALVVLILGGSSASAVVPPIVQPPVDPGGVGTGVPRAQWENFMRQRVFGLRVPGRVVQAGIPAVQGESASATSIRRIAGVQRSVGAAARGITLVPADSITSVTDPLSPKKAGLKVLGAAGSVLTAAWGADLVYQQFSGHGVLGSAFGFGGLYGSADTTTGNLLCDVKQIFNEASCAIAPAPDYVVNSDVPAWSPGWRGGRSFLTLTTLGGGSFGFTYPAGTMVVSFEVQHGGDQLTATAVPSRAFNPDASPYGESGYVRSGWSVAVYPDALSTGGASANWISNNPRILSTSMGADQAYSLAITDGTGDLSPEHAVIYYSPTHPDRPADQSADPARRWVTTWRCTDGSEGSTATDPWHETDPEWLAPASPSCSSSGLQYVRVQQVAEGLDPWTLYEWQAPETVQEYADAYPQCTDAACVLELLRVDAATGTRVACFDNPDACAKWFEDPARADSYVCTYGGSDVDLRECYVYAPTFDFTKAQPDTGTYADPETGVRPPSMPGSGDPTWEPNPCGDAPPFEFSLGGIGYWIAHGTNWALCKAFRPSRPLPTAAVTAAWNGSVLGWMNQQLGRTYGAFTMMPTGRCGVIARSDISAFGGREIRVSTCDEPWPSFAPVREVIGWGFIIGAIVVGLITCLNTIRVKPASGDK